MAAWAPKVFGRVPIAQSHICVVRCVRQPLWVDFSRKHCIGEQLRTLDGCLKAAALSCDEEFTELTLSPVRAMIDGLNKQDLFSAGSKARGAAMKARQAALSSLKSDLGVDVLCFDHYKAASNASTKAIKDDCRKHLQDHRVNETMREIKGLSMICWVQCSTLWDQPIRRRLVLTLRFSSTITSRQPDVFVCGNLQQRSAIDVMCGSKC